MLMIGCPKVKLLAEKMNGLNYEGVHFEVTSVEGLSMKVKHSAETDSAAKAVVKKYIAGIPELKNMYTNIQLIDEQGRIL